jgi:hypothetical protein
VADKATFKISAAAAPFIGADKPKEERLKAAAGRVSLPPHDFVLLVYYLCHDPDQEVKRAAVSTLRALDTGFLAQLLSDRELHPRILDALAQLHFSKAELSQLFATHPMLSEKTAHFLAERGIVPPQHAITAAPAAPEAGKAPAGGAGDAAQPADDAAEEEELVNEESEEFQSKYQMAQAMGVGDKIKMAMTGDKEWRSILIKDSNKLVSSAAIKNPRMSENEVLTIVKSAVQNEEIMRIICANKEWIKNPQIRKALAVNSKTPLPAALRFVATLSEKELSQIAKSKNVSSVVASHARRILFTKKDRK